MLVSFAIFHKGGLILFQHIADEETTSTTSSSSTGESSSSSVITNAINTWLTDIYLNPTISKTQNHKNYIDTSTSSAGSQQQHRTVIEWEEISELIAIAIYPDLRHEVDFPWISLLLKSMLNEYQLFVQASSDKENSTLNPKYDKYVKASSTQNQSLFNKTFQILFQQHRSNTTTIASKSSSTTTTKSNAGKASASGKEKRLWHDGKAKLPRRQWQN